MTNTKNNSLGYAGDITPTEAWQRLKENAGAVLIDVRTAEEWAYVGVVNLDTIDGQAYFVPWAFFPAMTANPNFINQVKEQACPTTDTPLLFLCRSGVRSVHAARALSEAGFTACYNILGGFEGDLDEHGHRSHTNGWKVDGLPWRQK
jgi:rhodanese-related sulfurtransferase